MTQCGQCGKPAVVSVGGNPLCVDCNLKLQQAISLRDARYASEMNYLTEQMESVVGLPGSLPRYQVPQPIIHQGVSHFHNIKVDNSVVGSINTGNVQNIDVTMSQIKAAGDKQLVQSLKAFTEAVINEVKIQKDQKNEIIEQLSFLMTELKAPQETRRKSVIKNVLSAIKDAVSTSTELLTLWDRLFPLLMRIFFH